MNKLDQLRQYTDVVADTGDIESISRFKPLDATTNPSLLLKAAELPGYQTLVQKCVNWAGDQDIPETERRTALTDYFAVCVGREILKLIPGRVSTEVDARLSFDTEATLKRAHRLLAFYENFDIGPERLLIKIAATWEGVRAAEELEKEGINCNLTLLFSDVQAVAAAQAGVTLVSPFVGRILDWHKNAHKVDSYPAAEDPGVVSVRNIYNLFKDRGYQTVVMGASFRNTGEIEELAGCDRLTIGPGLLEQLAADKGPLERKLFKDKPGRHNNCKVRNEADFRLQLNANAMATEKLAEGIRLFIADQEKLEKLLLARL